MITKIPCEKAKRKEQKLLEKEQLAKEASAYWDDLLNFEKLPQERRDYLKAKYPGVYQQEKR